MNIASRVDHLVVAVDTLQQGIQWCEATFGVTPGAGGAHPLMGTHNRLLRIATGRYPRAYLELIAIDPQARASDRTRWFDLDDPAVQQAVRDQPRLVAVVASCDDAVGAVDALRALAIDAGDLVAAERATPAGLLRWRISLRADGRRLFHGAIPTLIQWDGPHPADAMAESPVALLSLQVRSPRLAVLQAAHQAIGLREVELREGPPSLVASFATPAGTVILESGGA